MYQLLSVIGRVGKDCEINQTHGGVSVGNFSVACTEKWNKDGQKMEHTEWFNCKLFGKRVDSLGQYITKGSKIQVTGTLKTREHEGKRYTDLNVKDVTLLGDKSSNDRAEPQRSTPNLDDIPF